MTRDARQMRLTNDGLEGLTMRQGDGLKIDQEGQRRPKEADFPESGDADDENTNLKAMPKEKKQKIQGRHAQGEGEEIDTEEQDVDDKSKDLKQQHETDDQQQQDEDGEALKVYHTMKGKFADIIDAEFADDQDEDKKADKNDENEVHS